MGRRAVRCRAFFLCSILWPREEQEWQEPQGEARLPWLPLRLHFSGSVVSDSAATWTVARQAPLSMEFSRQGHWSGLPFPSSGGLPDPLTPGDLTCTSYAAGRVFTTESPGKPPALLRILEIHPLPVHQPGGGPNNGEVVCDQAPDLNYPELPPIHSLPMWLHQELPLSKKPKEVPEPMTDESPT